MYAFSQRHVARVIEHLGPDALQTLCTNLEGAHVVSLYSGLGGAELTVQSCWHAACAAAQAQGTEVPTEPPHMAVACDVDTACQQVLRQHHKAPDRIVGNLTCFLNQSLLPKLHALTLFQPCAIGLWFEGCLACCSCLISV